MHHLELYFKSIFQHASTDLFFFYSSQYIGRNWSRKDIGHSSSSDQLPEAELLAT